MSLNISYRITNKIKSYFGQSRGHEQISETSQTLRFRTIGGPSMNLRANGQTDPAKFEPCIQ